MVLMNKPEKLKMHTTDISHEKFAALASLFPHAVTETIDANGKVVRAIDADILAQEINSHVVSGKEERYQFTWPDKRNAMLLANAPIAAALRPCRDESVDFDTTKNLYIEGDNLDVLKLLRETYLNRVKMIYIDPPYNTGNDFVYEDDFAEDTQSFLQRDGQYDQQGNRLTVNTDSNGRFHTDWLNMIYPRLRVARDLLTDDGVIFISIDDNEIENLKKVCNEIFGMDNFVATICRISKTTSFRGNYFAPSKDYIVCFAKKITSLPNFVDDVDTSQFRKIDVEGFRKNEKYRDDIAFYLSTLETRPNQRYFIECPDGEKVIPPGTTFPPDKPIKGDGVWRWNLETFNQKKDLIVFKRTNRSPLINDKGEQANWNIYTKSYLSDKLEKGNLPRDIFDNFLNRNGSEDLKNLDIPFDFPKPVELLKHLLKIIRTNDKSIILDFFSGSATTAHAVMQLNAEDGGNRQFIMVQLPEETAPDSEAAKAGYKTICEIGKERIRRAGQKIKADSPLTTQELDIGFRVLKLDSSNMQDVYYNPDAVKQASFDITGLQDNIKPDRTSEDLLFQVLLDLGIPLSAKITQEQQLYLVDENYLIACFEQVNNQLLTEIAKKQPYYAVFRDSSFTDDSALVNLEQIFNSYSPNTIRKVL
jgi:adenine-specific DNA-methyltransferase